MQGDQVERGRRAEVRREQSLAKSLAAARDLTWGRFYVQAWFWCGVSLLLWFVFGIGWYVGWHEWPFWTALYYLGQATMSIGFGFPSEEDICNRKQDKDDTIGDGFSFSAARNWVNGKYHYPSVEEGGRGGCAASEISKAVTTMLVLYFAAVASASIGILLAKMLNPPGSWYKMLLKQAKLEALREKAENTPGWIDDAIIHLQLFWSQASWFKAVLALGCWSGVGVTFMMLSTQRAYLSTAVYFAVTSISTAGLEGLKPMAFKAKEEGAKDLSISAYEFYTSESYQHQFGFVAIYTIIGVPLFGWAVSEIGSLFANKILNRDAEITLHSAFTPEEFKLMRMLGRGSKGEGHETGQITMHKFVECQLLRMGKVSVEELHAIKKRFVELDLDNSGLISEAELEDTGSNLKSQELDTRAVEEALRHLEKMEKELWSDGESDGGQVYNGVQKPLINGSGPYAPVYSNARQPPMVVDLPNFAMLPSIGYDPTRAPSNGYDPTRPPSTMGMPMRLHAPTPPLTYMQPANGQAWSHSPGPQAWRT